MHFMCLQSIKGADISVSELSTSFFSFFFLFFPSVSARNTAKPGEQENMVGTAQEEEANGK